MSKLAKSKLFIIENNFYIRYNRDAQKVYNDILWLNWIFYPYLSTIHTIIRIINCSEGENSNVNQ
jgi:hypothetical protein